MAAEFKRRSLWHGGLAVILPVILAALTLLLGGCQPAVAAVDSDVVHLTLWQGINPPSNRDVFQRLVDRFNQTHPEIQVESLYVGQADQQMPKILAAVVGNAAPDLLWFAPTITGQLVELDALKPLDDWFASSPLAAQIDPALLETMQWEGHVWSAPFDVNNVGIFYRPSRFAAAGITELPQTWDDLRQAARQLTQPDRHQYGMLLPLGKGEWTVFMWLPFLWSGGGELLTGDRPHLTTAGAASALQFWQELVRDGSAILSQPERGYELEDFLSGKVAMQLTGPWTLGQLRATGVDFAVLPIPALKQGDRPATSIGGENLFVFRSNPQREQAALQFVEYVLSEGFQTEWAVATGYLPVNLTARQNPTYQQFVAQQPAIRTFLQQAQYGRSRPLTPGYTRISDQLGRAIEAVLLQKASPEAALKTAQKRLEAILASP